MTSEEKIQLLAQKLTLLSSSIEKQRSDIEIIRQQIEMLATTPAQKEKLAAILNQIKPLTAPVQQAIVPPTQQVITPPEEKVITPPVEQIITPPAEKKEEVKEPVKPVVETPVSKTEETITQIPAPQFTIPVQQAAKPKKSFNFEEYIGGKLAGIIGIIILVIGIAIGVKYAIDRDLINPLTRIIFGFLAGGILMTIAIILKKKYQLFSAIVLGGAVSTLFFTAFAGHAFYDIYPRGFAFGVMLVITAFTVFAAHSYNYEIIAVIGLVGAYAIPPLLSDGSGKIEYMFTYMAIINSGILVLSLFKNWKWVKYSAYGLTWLLVASWVLTSYQLEKLNITVIFTSIFFLTFYATFIAYKIIRKIAFDAMDIITLFSNSSIYFGLGYYALNNQFTEKYLGLFCIFNALVHTVIAYAAYAKKVTDKNMLYLILALVFTFLTIAIPVQLEGKVVTLCWFAETAVLFFIGRKFSVPFFKHIAYAVSLLGFMSLWHDWAKYYIMNWDSSKDILTPVLINKMFMTSCFAMAALGGLWFMFRNKFNPEEEQKKDPLFPVAKIVIPALFLITTYFTFMFEIANYFHNWDVSTTIKNTSSVYIPDVSDKSIPVFLGLWLMIYTVVFSSAILFINAKTARSKGMHWGFFSFSLLSLLLLFGAGLSALATLRGYYYSSGEDYFANAFKTEWMLNFRYVFFLFTLLALLLVQSSLSTADNKVLRSVYTWVFHTAILVMLSSELVNQFRISHPDDAIIYERIARRMGFTILWALYSTVLIIVGIARKMKMMRIMGFSLFGITLIKLLIDSINMSLGYKLIVYISVGIILTTIGFLYQRFKKILFEDDKEEGHA